MHGSFVSANKELLTELPPPSEEWECSEIGIHHGKLSELRERGIIRPTESRNEHGNRVWRTDDFAYREIQKYLD